MNRVEIFKKKKNKKTSKRQTLGSQFYLLGAGIAGGVGRSAMPIISWL
jgi:hypothetical protein